jgi:hypothetical protein
MAVVLAAAIGCGIGCAIVLKRSESGDSKQVGERAHMPEDHFELHKRLELSAAQKRDMDVLEEAFGKKLAELGRPIQEANSELATALVEDRSHSPRVRDAIEKIHRAQAELQNATIEHILEMRTVLDEDQFTKFLRATADSLRAK